MDITLVNGYLAFKYITEQQPTLREFTNGVALAMCAKVMKEGGRGVAEATRGALLASEAALEARVDPGSMPHTLFSGRALQVGGTRGEGQCRLCLRTHASGVCKTYTSCL
jgi:hypothetical protein